MKWFVFVLLSVSILAAVGGFALAGIIGAIVGFVAVWLIVGAVTEGVSMTALLFSIAAAVGGFALAGVFGATVGFVAAYAIAGSIIDGVTYEERQRERNRTAVADEGRREEERDD